MSAVLDAERDVTTFTSMWRKVMNSLRKERVRDGNCRQRVEVSRATVHPQLRLPQGLANAVTPYHFDPARQLNVLPDGRPAVSDPELLLAAGTTTSTAGSATHFDD